MVLNRKKSIRNYIQLFNVKYSMKYTTLLVGSGLSRIHFTGVFLF